MLQNSEEIAQAIEDGSYFREGRAWYSTVYMSIISERYFFIVLTSVAAATALFALVSVARLLPLNPRLAFLYEAENAYEQIPIVKPIRDSRDQPINEAFRKFFVLEYVQRREGYSSESLGRRLNFVRANSDESVLDRYARSIDPQNPRSPAQRLGNLYTMSAQADPATLSILPVEGEKDLYTASVEYELSLFSQTLEKKVRYRADLTFDYKDLIVDQTESNNDDERFRITPMQFKVVDYSFKQIR